MPNEAEDLDAFHARIQERLKRARRASLDQQTRAAALIEIAQEIRNHSLRVRTCAWCESVSVREGWYPPSVSELVTRLSSAESASHGICPVCFAKLAPGARYPG
jgi:hypothetical protein